MIQHLFPARSSIRILLVEDEALIALHVRRMLEQLGYTVAGVAEAGPVAIRLAEEALPDLILMDIRIQGSMDGVEAATAIRSAHDIPIIFLTANADASTIERARLAGPYGFLIKPVNPVDLLSSIDTALQRHSVETALRQSEGRYRSLVEMLPQRVCVRDRAGVFVSCNPRYAADFGLRPEDLAGRRLEQVFPAALVERIRLFDLRVLTSGTPEAVEVDYPFADGRPALISSTPVRDDSGALSGVLVVIEDISERKRLEGEVRKAHLVMEHRAEEERRRLSRELHDELGQLLTAIRLDASALKTQLEGGSELEAIERIMSSSEEAIERVRNLSFGLRPPILDDFGLAAAIESRLDTFSKQTGLRCIFHSGPGVLPGRRDEAGALFRIFQELLTNVARHAQARSVRVELEAANGRIRLSVLDDGVGMDDRATRAPTSLGFLGMRERAALFGGEIVLASQPGRGTHVQALLPFPMEPR